MRGYTALTALCTWLLVIAGGLVTSNDAALSIPDWPLAWGRLIPPLEGNIRFEFAHRVLAAIVALMVTGLAFWLHAAEPRAWVRKLGWIAVAAVAAQALLGGAAVLLATPRPVTIAHASLAEICFGLVVAILVGQSALPATHAPGPIPPIAAAALFLQTVLGAAVRHSATNVLPHLVGAVAATALVMWAALGIISRHMDDAPLCRLAALLLFLTFAQIFLGMAALMSRIATADAPQPMPVMIWSTVAHVAVGSLAFGAAIAMAMVVYWHPKPRQTDLLHGGMAVA